MTGQQGDALAAVASLGRSHAQLLGACCHAADAAHLLRMGGADAEAVALAQGVHQALLAQVEAQVELARLLGIGEDEPIARPVLTLIQGGAQ